MPSKYNKNNSWERNLSQEVGKISGCVKQMDERMNRIEKKLESDMVRYSERINRLEDEVILIKGKAMGIALVVSITAGVVVSVINILS